MKEHEACASAADLSRRHGVAENTIYRSPSKFGGMEVSDAERVRTLEQENRRLKHLLTRVRAGQVGAQGVVRGKVITPAERRQAVEKMKDCGVSERRVCRLVNFSRSCAQHEPKERNDGELRRRMRESAALYPRYGYVTLHKMLRDEGLVVNIKRTYRICREEGLQVRTKKRKRLVRTLTADGRADGDQPTLVAGLRVRPARGRAAL